MDMGNCQRTVHFIPTQANMLMVSKLMDECAGNSNGNGRQAIGKTVRFVPVDYHELATLGQEIEVLIWGEGTQHQASYFLDRIGTEEGGAKASVDAHFDFQAVLGKNGLSPVEGIYEPLTCANHLVFSRLMGKEIKIVIPKSKIPSNLEALERITRTIADGIGEKYDEDDVRKVIEKFSLIGIEGAQNGALVGVEHLTVDCDAIECFPSIPKWILNAEQGFSIEQVVGVIRRLRENGQTVFDFGGLMKSIPDFQVVELPQGFVPRFLETEDAVEIALHGALGKMRELTQGTVDRVYTYALNCYEKMIRAYFGLE